MKSFSTSSVEDGETRTKGHWVVRQTWSETRYERTQRKPFHFPHSVFSRLSCKDATSDQIRHAYKAFAKKYHPDKNPGDYNAQEAFKRVSEAYEVLIDEERRESYHRLGHFFFKGTFSTPPPKPDEDSSSDEEAENAKEPEEKESDPVAKIQLEIEETEDWLKERMSKEPLTRIDLVKITETNSAAMNHTMLNLQSKVFPLWRQVQEECPNLFYPKRICVVCRKIYVMMWSPRSKESYSCNDCISNNKSFF